MQPFQNKPPGPPLTYMGSAHAMMRGARALADAQPVSGIPLAFLAAQALECALKAYLSRGGDDARLKSHALRHDLQKLWALAAAEGLSIPASPPAWVTNLSELHGVPYFLRYSTGVNVIVTPGNEPMTSELEELVAHVAAGIAGA